MKPKEKLSITVLLSYACSLSFFGCASIAQKPPSPEPVLLSHDFSSEQIERLNHRIQELELKVYSLNDKLEASVKHPSSPQTPLTPSQITPVKARPTDQSDDLFTPELSKKDPEVGFTEDTSVKSFRRAMIFFEAHRYPEAILEFNDFIGKYPKHILAGSAQYFCGESYYQQNEYKLALQEFENVLTHHPNSPHATDSLHRISELQNQLKLREKIRETAEKLKPKTLRSSTTPSQEDLSSGLNSDSVHTPPPLTVPPPQSSTEEHHSGSIRREDHET